MSHYEPSSPPDPDQLGVALQTVVAWTRTADVDEPYSAVVDGRAWALRLGEFPAEPLYTLIVDGEAIGSFDTWPSTWQRPGQRRQPCPACPHRERERAGPQSFKVRSLTLAVRMGTVPDHARLAWAHLRVD